MNVEVNNKDIKIEKFTNQFIKSIGDNLEDFGYNKIIANIYQMYTTLNKEMTNEYSKDVLISNYSKILICIMPIIPHFSSQCLRELNVVEYNWPKYDHEYIFNEEVDYVIQINGKKRSLIKAKRNINQDHLLDLINKDISVEKYLKDKEIKKKIFVQNKLINLII